MSLEHELLSVPRARDWGILSSKEISGKCVCTSGQLSVLRAEFVSLAVGLGASFSDRVSGGVDYLVVPDTATFTSAKSRRAQALDVKIITESQFCGMIVNY